MKMNSKFGTEEVLDSAYVYFQRALVIAQDNNLVKEKLPVFVNYARLERISGNLNFAEEYILDAKELSNILNSTTLNENLLLEEAKVNLSKNEYYQVIEVCDELIKK